MVAMMAGGHAGPWRVGRVEDEGGWVAVGCGGRDVGA